MDFLKGHIIRGKYVVVKALGQGSSAKVYECEDMQTRKHYAVKVVKKAYQSEESSIMKKLSHPNIPMLKDFHEEGHLRYMIMEMCKGQTLQSHLEKGKKFEESEAAVAMHNIMTALEVQTFFLYVI
uniref:calcium-dependent protein kinase 2-like n=1 Tax=Erigeron canadensis TaxID=72917 RepID=UPI001CB98239|nr:calcium-dependent protein kinase 2-like [Erigeron canadensis]